MSQFFGALRRNAPRYVPVLIMLAIVVLLLSGCETDTPQNTFAAEGEVARKQRDLFYLAMWPAIGVMILVLGGVVLICLRFRERNPNALPPKQVEGNTRLELTWTIAPGILLLILGIPTVTLIYDLGKDPDPDAYVINIEAQRYNFTFSYPDITDTKGNPLQLDGLLQDPHIPVGKQVAFHLSSSDVIHSFWLPRLGGKLDIVPNEDNVLWLVADKADTFHGECAEYCGLDHAAMRMIVHADAQEDFDAWIAEKRAVLNATPKPTPTPAPRTPTSAPTGIVPASATASPTPTAAPVGAGG